jgi:hypothetical protein
MLERLLLPEKHAISILLKDHDAVKALFERFEKAKRRGEKEHILQDAVLQLKIHATIEEDIFYPAVRPHVGNDVMNEADEEHHVARVLIAELDNGRPTDDHRFAKFEVLSENVRHHIKEEENDVLPKAKDAKIDFTALGERMLDLKSELNAKGVPADAEHAMVAAAGARADTPARRARSQRPLKAKSQRRQRPTKKVQRRRSKRHAQ